MIITSCKRCKHVIGVAILLLMSAVSYSQDPQFSQFFANPMYTNPAFAGTSTVARGVLNYRSQWPGISGTFRTFSASYDEHFDALNGGIGIMVMGDEAGVGTLRTTSVTGVYSYQIVINKKFTIRPALQIGIQQRTIDFGKLQFYDQIVTQQGFVLPTSETPINDNPSDIFVGAGLLAYNNNFYGGFAVHNINEPNQGFYKSSQVIVPMRYTVHAGMMIPLTRQRDNKGANLWPNILYMQQANFTQINAGMYMNKDKYLGGIYLRQTGNNADAIIILLGLRFPKYRFGFSYDATLSDARPGARQSYEVSIGIELKKRVKKTKLRPVICPEF